VQITSLFDEPFSTATAAAPSSISPSVVGINGVPFLLDTRDDANYQRESFDVVQQRNTSDARDVLLLPQDVWRQQVQSWHSGAGQSNMDRDASITTRFEDSFGVDPWTMWEIKLLKRTEKLVTKTGKTWLTLCDSKLVVINGVTISWYAFLTDPSPVVMTPAAGDPIIDIADTGGAVTTLHASGDVWQVTGSAATPAKIKTHVGSNMIAYEKDYLIMGDTNKLYNITGTSNTLVYTHPVAGFRWESAAPGNSCIYILGGIGDRWVVHRMGIKSDGSGLAVPIVAGQLPDGEIGYKIEQYLGFILIGTNRGVRLAVADANGDLTLGPLIPTTQPVRCFEGQDRFVWFGMSDMAATYDTGADATLFPQNSVCGLGRIDLSTFTTTALTPSYANDLCAVDETGKDVTSCVTFDGKRIFAITDSGVYKEMPEDMPAGWLKQGTMSFSVTDTKTGLYQQCKTKPLIGAIGLDISYDDSGFIRAADLTLQNSISSTNLPLNGARFSRFNVRYVLKRDSIETGGPRLTRWEFRAIPVKGRASRWTLPILNHETLEIDGVTVNRDPLAVLESLITLAESGSLFTLQEAGRAFQVHIKKFLWSPQRLTASGKAWQGVLTLVVEEVQ